jgi:hypothetical protein
MANPKDGAADEAANAKNRQERGMTATLNAYQKSVISETLPAYKGVFVKAYTSGSKANAIKAFCLYCTGSQREEIKGCTSYGCPLYSHRPYRPED